MINRRFEKYSLNKKHFVHCSFLGVLYLLIYDVFFSLRHDNSTNYYTYIQIILFCKSFCTFCIRSADATSDVFLVILFRNFVYDDDLYTAKDQTTVHARVKLNGTCHDHFSGQLPSGILRTKTHTYALFMYTGGTKLYVKHVLDA